MIEDIKLEALKAVEHNRIVFLDELDKIASRSDIQGTPMFLAKGYSVICYHWLREPLCRQVRDDQNRSHLVHCFWRLSYQAIGLDT